MCGCDCAAVVCGICRYADVCVRDLQYDVGCFFFFQAEDGIRDLVRSRGLGDVYKRQGGSERRMI